MALSRRRRAHHHSATRHARRSTARHRQRGGRGEEIMNYEGVDMPTHIVIYSKDMTSEVKFDPFFITIETRYC